VGNVAKPARKESLTAEEKFIREFDFPSDLAEEVLSRFLEVPHGLFDEIAKQVMLPYAEPDIELFERWVIKLRDLMHESFKAGVRVERGMEWEKRQAVRRVLQSERGKKSAKSREMRPWWPHAEELKQQIIEEGDKATPPTIAQEIYERWKSRLDDRPSVDTLARWIRRKRDQPGSVMG
jgi:hypothetical protein